MWWLLRLSLLLLVPAMAWGQAIDQKKVGFYLANKAGSDCSQTTLEAADDAALAAGQTLVLTPEDRLGNACQWVVSSTLTIDSALFIPYDTTPVLKVNSGITLTLQECPYTWGNYFIIDANGTTTGTVAYSTTCARCNIAGANNWIQCTVGGDVSINQISDLGDVNADVDATDDTYIVGNGTEYRKVTRVACNPATDISSYDADTNTESCVADVGGSSQTLDGAFDTGTGEIDGAACETKVFRISRGGDDYLDFCVDSSGVPKIIATCDAAGCDNTIGIATDRNYIINDVEAALDVFTIDPDAASINAMYQYGANYQPLVTAEVVLRPFGDCTATVEAIIANDPGDDWITCADATGDGVSFSYKVTTKISGDTTVKITMLGVNKNAAPTGNFDLQCAGQSVRPGTDAYAAHNTTGQQTVSFSTFDTQYRPESATATFTLNGTVATGAHIKAQCNVSAAPGQINDIRLHGTALIELSSNSPSD